MHKQFLLTILRARPGTEDMQSRPLLAAFIRRCLAAVANADLPLWAVPSLLDSVANDNQSLPSPYPHEGDHYA